MEDTHVWVMDADGANRREVGRIDNRQGAPEWSADGSALYFTVQERGEYRAVSPAADWRRTGCRYAGEGSVGGWSPLRDGRIVYAFARRRARGAVRADDWQRVGAQTSLDDAEQGSARASRTVGRWSRSRSRVSTAWRSKRS